MEGKKNRAFNLQDRMDDLGIRALKSLGQNFLIDSEVVTKILKEVKKHGPENLIEIGPGMGALTESFLELKIPLVLVEVDRKIAQHWREKGVSTVHRSALDVNWGKLLSPESKNMVVGNLPYNVASAIFVKLCLQELPSTQVLFMFQKEVACRVVAQPHSKDYSLLSILAQTFWKPEVLFSLGPDSFYPRPKIHSSMVFFSPSKATLKSRKAFLRFLKVSFSSRRKKLVKNWKKNATMEEFKSLKKALENRASGDVRPEQLSPKNYLEIYKEAYCS